MRVVIEQADWPIVRADSELDSQQRAGHRGPFGEHLDLLSETAAKANARAINQGAGAAVFATVESWRFATRVGIGEAQQLADALRALLDGDVHRLLNFNARTMERAPYSKGVARWTSLPG